MARSGPYTPDLAAIRSNVNWGQTWLWDIKFDSAPAPFNLWFPAFDAEEELAQIASFPIPVGNNSYNIPSDSAPKTLSLSFYDDHKGQLYQWLLSWANSIIRTNGTTATLTEACRDVYIAQLDTARQLVRTHITTVYPEGAVKVVRNSQPGASLLVQQFKVAGIRIS